MKTLHYWISTTLGTVMLGLPLVAWAGPALYYEKLWLNLSVSSCLQNAEMAIAESGVPILNVNGNRVLAVNQTVSVAIDCENIQDKTRAVVIVSSSGDNPMQAIELSNILKKAMGNGGMGE